MQETIKYFPVNWVDGMKINKDHFIAEQNNMIDLVRDTAAYRLNTINHGLLPLNGRGEALKISLVVDNHKLLRVRIDECSGITLSGARVEINSSRIDSKDFKMPYPEATYDIEPGKESILLVVISVNLFNKTEFGNPDPEEDPPRHPFVVPEYKLHLIPEAETEAKGLGTYYLLVGKIRVTEHETTLIKDYIPPCTTVSSHRDMMSLYTKLDSFLGQLEIYSIQITQKIHRNHVGSELVQMMLDLCNRINVYLGGKINSFRWFSESMPPPFMLDTIVALARVMKNTIDARSGSGKEELLNYLSEWCELSQGQFEIMFSELINVGYDHMKIDKTIKEVKHFASVIEQLFATLNRLDYIGKRKDTTIFVKEQLALNEGFEKHKAKKSKRDNHFLAD